MTVVEFGKYGLVATEEKYLCKWFDEKNKPSELAFFEAELELVPASSSSSPGSPGGPQGWMA